MKKTLTKIFWITLAVFAEFATEIVETDEFFYFALIVMFLAMTIETAVPA